MARETAERKRKRGISKAFASALRKLPTVRGKARALLAERCGVTAAVISKWALGRERVPPDRREHLIWATGLGPCPGPPPPRVLRSVLRPPTIDPATVPHEPPAAIDAARALELVRAHRPATLAAVCGVSHETARDWKTGERCVPVVRLQQILASHVRGDLPGAP